MKINPNDPVQGFVDYGFADENNKGITIRTQIAAMCLQGLLSDPDINDISMAVISAVKAADALIDQLNKTS